MIWHFVKIVIPSSEERWFENKHKDNFIKKWWIIAGQTVKVETQL